MDSPPDTLAATSARHRAETALTRAVYLLDRGLKGSPKVRAFRNAVEVVESLDEDELTERTRNGTLTDLAGIGSSTGSVIADAVAGRPSQYLERLDSETACPPETEGGNSVRAAVQGDLHCHTRWSDGAVEVRDMAFNAMDLGHTYLAITDHSPRLTVAHGLSEDRLAEQLEEIAALNEELAPFRILTGMEVDILEDGTLDLSEESLAGLDVVVASVHSKLRMDSPAMTRRMVRAVANPHVDILGHCTGRQIVGRGRPPSTFDAEIVFAACSRFGTAVEINCRPERRDPPVDLLRLALEWGCDVSIDTDAHSPGQMEWQNWGCDLAAAEGIGPERIVNTWDAEDLLAWAGSHPST